MLSHCPSKQASQWQIQMAQKPLLRGEVGARAWPYGARREVLYVINIFIRCTTLLPTPHSPALFDAWWPVPVSLASWFLGMGCLLALLVRLEQQLQGLPPAHARTV